MGKEYTTTGLAITNNTGGTFIDPIGLVSTQNFTFGAITDTAQNTTSSTDYVDVSLMTLTFTLTRAANVLFMTTLNASNQSGNDNNGVLIIFNLNGTQVGPLLSAPGEHRFDGVNSFNKYDVASGQTIQQVAAGTNTIKLQFKATNGGVADIAGASEKFLGYLVLGN